MNDTGPESGEGTNARPQRSIVGATNPIKLLGPDDERRRTQDDVAKAALAKHALGVELRAKEDGLEIALAPQRREEDEAFCVRGFCGADEALVAARVDVHEAFFGAREMAADE